MAIVDISGVSDDARNLANFMQEMLGKVVTSFQSYSMPVPARTYYTFGAPAIDCEQLSVSFLQMYIGTPGDEATEPRRCNDPRSGTFVISIARQVPITQANGAPPSAQSIQDASEVSALDAWILMESTKEFDGSWGAYASGLGLGVIATVDVDSPEGGFQTTRMTITIAIP
jgi:hypothetical protein